MRIRNNRIRNLKKSQEEMVGFILIIILVVVIFVVFLAVTLRKKDSSEIEDVNLVNFLESVKKYTSDCKEGREANFYSIGELTGECYKDSLCSDGRKTCEVLENDFQNILEKVFPVSEVGPYKYYKLDIYYGSDDTAVNILEITEGNSTFNKNVAEFTILESSIPIKTKLEVSY